MEEFDLDKYLRASKRVDLSAWIGRASEVMPCPWRKLDASPT